MGPNGSNGAARSIKVGCGICDPRAGKLREKGIFKIRNKRDRHDGFPRDDVVAAGPAAELCIRRLGRHRSTETRCSTNSSDGPKILQQLYKSGALNDEEFAKVTKAQRKKRAAVMAMIPFAEGKPAVHVDGRNGSVFVCRRVTGLRLAIEELYVLRVVRLGRPAQG
jgi:hypothetical protein